MCLQSIPSTFRAACRVSTLCCLAAVLCIGKNILALGSKSLDWDGATAETLRESPRVRSKILELAMGSSPCKATASSRTCSLPSTALERFYKRGVKDGDPAAAAALGLFCGLSLWSWQGMSPEQPELRNSMSIAWEMFSEAQTDPRPWLDPLFAIWHLDNTALMSPRVHKLVILITLALYLNQGFF